MIAASTRPVRSPASRFSVSVLLDVERHLRRGDVQLADQVGQQVRRHRVDDAEPQRAGELVAPADRDLADARRLLEHLLRLLDDPLADRRDRDLALAALEQRRAELLLELLDRDRQRRLADEALARRAAEAALLRDRDDVAQLVQRHRRTPRRRRAPRCCGPVTTCAARETGRMRRRLRCAAGRSRPSLRGSRACCRNRSGGRRTRTRARALPAAAARCRR